MRSSQGSSYTYDPNGNLTQKTEGSDTWTYEWNAENELTRVTRNSIEQARFSYDPLGRRVEKAAGGVAVSFTYQRETILRELRGGATLKYVHGQGVDEPLSADNGVSPLYFHVDGLGSVVRVTSSSGSVTLTREYDSWGVLQVGGTDSGHAFTAREWEPETGLYYYRARYYDPAIGRFISSDPIGLRGGDNVFAYAEDDPVNLSDPWGLQASKPKRPSPPNPTPTPTPRPKITPRPPNTGNPLYNLCPKDEKLVFWDFTRFNPNVPGTEGAWKRWRDAFTDKCTDSEPKGADYRAHSQIINVGMISQSEYPSAGVGCCCEKCSK